MKGVKIIAMVALAVAVVLLASACSGGASQVASPTPPLLRTTSGEVTKPKPAVLSVNAITAGLFESYFAVLEVTVTNEGSDGVIVVVGSIAQGGVTTKNEMPVYLAHNAIQSVRLAFPLQWKGGDWTPNVTTEIP